MDRPFIPNYILLAVCALLQPYLRELTPSSLKDLLVRPPTETEEANTGLLTIDAAANRWNCCAKTIRRMVDDGRLPSIRIGRVIRIREHDIVAYERRELRNRRHEQKQSHDRSV